MPSYYFRFQNGITFRDGTGLVFDNLPSACDAARVALAKIQRERDAKGHPEMHVEIVDGDDQVLATVRRDDER
jgi:hypothetical protein